MRLVIVGAGPIGIAAAHAALDEGVATAIAAVVDPDPAARHAGAEEFACPGLGSVGDLPPAEEGDTAIVAFSSRAEPTAAEVVRLLGAGYDVVTTCEELSDPDDHLRVGISQSAGSDGAVVIATGANPGFVMDRLPVVVASASRSVRSVEVRRTVDTSRRRDPLVAKTGRGLTVEEFRAGVSSGHLGHVGMAESARLLADGLGWSDGRLTESIEPVVAGGVVTGLHQRVALRCRDDHAVTLDLVMAWDVEDPGDRIVVNGSPRIEVAIEGGFHGDLGTSAQVVQALRWIPALDPGFYRPIDLPVQVGR